MRIWITGIGAITPLARGAGATMDRLVAGDRAFGPLTLFEVREARVGIAAEVKDLAAAEVAPPGEEEGWSRTDAMSVLAVREALAQAGVDARKMPIDLIVGGTTAGMFETEDLLAELSLNPAALAPLKRMLSHPLSSTADHVRAAVGPFRRVRSVCSACSSGANAMLLAASWIRAGMSNCVVAGGADGLCRLTYTGFGALAALDPGPCRPFDRRRAGLNLGEAAAFLVLEPEASARARGAVPIAELRGWAVGAEAHHITNPEAEGLTASRVMRRALARAALTPADLDYVNAHGTATQLNDAMESAALRACLGSEIARVPVSSAKGQIGHTLGAAGALEAVISALAIQRGIIPPTIGLEEVDPRCDLVHVTEARSAPLRAVMSNSFGFGGTDAVLVLARPYAFPDPDGGAPIRLREVVITGAATVGPLGVNGVVGSTAYLDSGPLPADGAIPFNAADHLDVSKARRLDRAGRLATVAIATALKEAGLAEMSPETALGAGAIVGASFGSVDQSTAYMRRIYEKGAKYASPADFPNLVPSSPVGHASIYLGLRGPVFAIADLGATAESAIATAAELVSAGEGDTIAAGSVEEASAMIERVLGPVCSEIDDRGVRSEGAAILVVEAADAARARGATPLAKLAWWTSWRGDGTVEIGEAPPPPGEGAVALFGREDERTVALLDASPWAKATRQAVSARAGDHEGAGGFAAAAAVGAIARGSIRAALVVGVAPDRGYALLLVPAGPGQP